MVASLREKLRNIFIKITLTHGIYADLSNKNGWDVKAGEGFSMCYLKEKDTVAIVVVII